LEIGTAVTTFALSSIGKTSGLGSAGAPNATQPASPPPVGSSPFDLLLQSAGNAAPPAAAGETPAASGTADAGGQPTDGTKAQGSGTRMPPPIDGAPDKASQNASAGNGAGAPAGSAQADDDPTAATVDSAAVDSATAAGAPNDAAPDAATDAEAESEATMPAFDPKLLNDLTSALDELEADEKNGIAPSKDLLKRLQQAVDAMSGYLAALQQGAPPPLAGTPAEARPSEGASTAVAGLSGAATALKQLLSTLADGAPGGASNAGIAAATGAGAGPATGDAADPTLAQLTDKLAALSADLAPTQPSLASDLDHLASQLQYLPSAAAGSAQQAKVAGAPGDTTKAAATAALPPGPLAAPLPAPTGPKDKAASQPENMSVKTAASPAADSKMVSSKADVDQTGGDNKKDATAGAPAANTAVNTPASPGQAASTGTAPPHGAVTLNAAQPTAGPAAAAAQQAQQAYQAADTAPINLPQMAFEIARQVQHGTSEFQIQLAPADLGRVNVTLAVDPTGNVSAHLAVERADTLALLRQDASNLNQALAQAGLAGGKTNLQFSLSQNPFARQDNGGQPASPTPAPTGDESLAAPMPVAPVITRYRGSFATSNLNIFV
jgi:hypothetical protein